VKGIELVINGLNGSVMGMLNAIGSIDPLPVVPMSPRKHVKKYGIDRSKYEPHQGKRECARRVRQMGKEAAQ
jgi:hypothetical protein